MSTQKNSLYYTTCPKCNSREHTAGQPQCDGDVWVDVKCNNCDFEWVEVYTFSHNENREADKLDNLGCVIKSLDK